MNKSVKIVKVWVIVSIVLCTLLVSCKNFLDSTGLEDFYKALEYVNSAPFTIRFSAEGGKISPSGDYSLKVADKVNLIFNPESDKCFINWEVYSGDKLLSKEELSKYIDFENLEEPETTIQILQKTDNLKIQAKTVNRPKIVSATPSYDVEGSYRDRRITIMFDKRLNKDSIYFSKKELAEAGVWDLDRDCVKPGYTVLDRNGDKNYFGYQKTGDDNSIIWKVATITKRIDESVNLLRCYECPEFDMNDTSVLRITAKRVVSQMPPINTDILVNIKTNFGLLEKTVSGAEKLVTLNSAYAWSYLTNSIYDNERPKITELVLYTVKDGDTDFTSIKDNTILYQRDNDHKVNNIDIKSLIEKDPMKEENNYFVYNLSQGKMWVKAQVNDIGSGPKALTATITKVNTTLYPCESDKEIEDVAYTAKLSIIGPNAYVYTGESYEGEFFDVSQLKESGLFKITFKAIDRNDLDCYEEAYFFYDGSAPTLKTPIKECRKEAGKTTLSYALNESDYWKAEIYTQKLPAGANTLQPWTVTTAETVVRPENYSSGVSFGNGVSGLNENKLEDGTKYQHKVVLVDYSGNRSEPIEVEIDNTPPGKITNFFAGARKDKIDLFYTTPSNDDFEKIELSYGSVDTDTESIMLSKSSNLSKQITGLTNGESYSYYIRTVDYSGNKSDPVSVTQKAKISIGDICYFVNTSTILVSNSYYSGSNIKPAGIVCDITDYGKSTDYSKVRIWDLTKKQNLIWGTMDKPPYSDHSDTSNDPHFYTKDGLATYNKYYNSFPAGTFNNSSSYWYWLKNTKNKNSPVTWYIPTYQEIQEFYVRNYSDLKTTFETLKANNIQVDPQTSPLTTCIPSKYDNSTAKGYARAYINYSSTAAITFDVTFRDGQSSNCQCMAQVNLN